MNSWILGSVLSFGVSKLLSKQTTLNISVKHAIPGRIRLQCERWKDQEIVEVLEEIMSKHPLIRDCTASSITGSLLLEFKKEYLTESEFNQVLKRATSATVKGFSTKEADALKVMKKVVNKVDGTIKSKSLGVIDLKSLIILSLVVKGVLALKNNPEESGRQLIWAYRFLAGEGVKN